MSDEYVKDEDNTLEQVENEDECMGNSEKEQESKRGKRSIGRRRRMRQQQ